LQELRQLLGALAAADIDDAAARLALDQGQQVAQLVILVARAIGRQVEVGGSPRQ
jgi:hypothetical protein